MSRGARGNLPQELGLLPRALHKTKPFESSFQPSQRPGDRSGPSRQWSSIKLQYFKGDAPAAQPRLSVTPERHAARGRGRVRKRNGWLGEKQRDEAEPDPSFKSKTSVTEIPAQPAARCREPLLSSHAGQANPG
ncbi:2-amino-3-ketobutyrate CoA ligase [Platysternon megacephalum]|uniref:2-amino-3-ketobutyrate CoA ligase n=1 Tax=Platysternon megacephalum TaxID=55544 RepID=A0A4D9DHA7_9SAUR|nr:2-amino-3-ketobutyrate CoA ligase [Platysternon megacephalum]